MKHPQKPVVRDVLKLIKEFYAMPGNEVGGILHSMLDDGNVRNSHIISDWKCAANKQDILACRICEQLLLMTRSQRRRLLSNNFYNFL